MDKLKNSDISIKRLRAIPLKTLGAVIVCLIFITGLSANAATISGTVTEAGTSTTIANVRINVNNGMYTATTDGSGYYEILGLSSGCYDITAHPPTGDHDHVISARQHTYVDTTATVDFALETGALSISGNVQAGGVGLNGVEINYYSDILNNGQRTYTVTDTLVGDYILYNLPPGQGELQVRANGTTWAFTGENDLNLTGNLTGKNFTLVPEACISGRVVDQDNDGVAGVWVQYWSESHANGSGSNTDGNGYFSIWNLPPGIGQIEIEPNPGTGFCETNEPFIYLNEGEIKDIGIMKVQKGALVDGTAIDADGIGISGLEIESDGIDFDSDGDVCNGTYQLLLPEGTHRIYLDTHGNGPYPFAAYPVEVTVTSGDVGSGVPVTVPEVMTVYSEDDIESATLSGQLSNTSGYDPTGFLKVEILPAGILEIVTPENLAGTCNVQGVRLDDFGSFSLTPVPPGAYDVLYFLVNETPDGLESTTILGMQKGITVSESDSIPLPNFDYSAQGSPLVEGDVNDNFGDPVLGALVLIIDDMSGDLAAIAQTDETGHYIIYNLPAGTYTVQASHNLFTDRPSTSIISTNGDDTLVPELNFTFPVSQFSVTGTVKNVHKPDGFYTSFEIVIGNDLTGTLPDDIDTITVTGPSGELPYTKEDFIYYPQWREFFISIPGSPEIGTYTFVVTTTGGLTGTATDTQTVNRPMPIPDSNTFSPNQDGTLSTKTSVFSWDLAVPDPGVPTYYRLLISDMDGNWIFHIHPFVEDMTSYTVSDVTILTPGQTYNMYIRVYDGEDWVQAENYSISDPVTFTMERDPKRLHWFELLVRDGDLIIDFSVLQGFRNKLESAVLNIPNSSRTEYPEYTFDPVNDRILWDTECRYVDLLLKDFGAVKPNDYGDYTLTLNFSDGAQEVYTRTLQNVSVQPVANIQVFPNNDGSLYVTWDRQTTDDYYYQIRIRDGNDKEYCRVGPFLNATEAYLSAYDLRCLTKGETYRLLVRVYDGEYPDYNTIQTTEISGEYSPASLTHTDSYGVWDWKGELALGFDTRPGSRDQILSTTVTGPASFEYPFNLEADWLPLSTETRLNMDMWWRQDDGWPITSGDYTFTIDFDEDGDNGLDVTEQYTRSLNVCTVIPVESSSMSADIEDSGAITFFWGLPGGSNQVYQAIIRSEDESKEYYRSSNLNDATEITASFWDLRSLEHGQIYQWFVRSMVSGCNTVKQSESLFFAYNPFDAEGDGLFDLYDPDDDNDGLYDSVETNTGIFVDENNTGTDPLNPDDDGDGLCDGAEVNIYGTNPVAPNEDTDNDDLLDSVETGTLIYVDENDTGTYFDVADSDDDGLNDGEEVYVYLTNPTDDDSDDDTAIDGDDAFPLDDTESADFDSDGIGDNADNCPNDFNDKTDWTDINGDQHTDEQPDFDLDGKGDVCDEDADNDGYISPYLPDGNDCDDLDPTVYPGAGGCEDIALKGKPPKVTEKPDSDGDGVDDTLDNCPGVANSGQTDSDGDGVGDACDTCPNVDNPDQKIPVWYKDLDNDGYSDGQTLEQCSPTAPVGYKAESDPLLLGMNDCDDSNSLVNPGLAETPDDGLDNDCNPETPDVPQDYTIQIKEMKNNGQIVSYDEWLPVDGDTLVVDFKVVDANGNEIQAPSFIFSLAQVTHHSGKYTNDPSEESQTPAADFDTSVSGQNQVTLLSHDYGGSITIHAEAEITGQVPIIRDITFPRDMDRDGMADFWESQYGDLDPAADIDGDGLTNLEEYRVVMWGKMDRIEPNSTYQSVAYIPQNSVTPIRPDPTRRDLFVQFMYFDAAHPFAIGEAHHQAGIDVYALDVETVSAHNLSDNYNIDVLTVTLSDSTFGFETGHIIKRGVMDYTFATLGLSSYGSDTAYGANCTVFKTSIDYYFSDSPYKDFTTFDGTNMRDQNAWGPKNGVLDMMPNVEDKDDDGKKDGGEDKSGNGMLDGDYIVRAGDGIDPWDFNQDLSPFNINNDPVPLVELPVADTSIEYTKAQVLKHVITHEIGHNTGVNLHTDDPLCVMYKYSIDWLRDNHFCDMALELIMIHN